MLTLMSLSSLPWALRMITWVETLRSFSDPAFLSLRYLVNPRFLSPRVDHRKVNAVSPGQMMLSKTKTCTMYYQFVTALSIKYQYD